MKKLSSLLCYPMKTSRGTIRVLFALVAVACCLLCFAVSAAAAYNFTVTSLSDLGDANLDGTCGALHVISINPPVFELRCTLRAALEEIQDGGTGVNTVSFDPTLSGTITLSSALPTITKHVTITGTGTDAVAVDGDHGQRIFSFSTSPTVVIEGLTLKRGSAGSGGAVYQSGGSLTLREVVVKDNSVTDFGGGVYCSSCSLTVQRSRISDNTSVDSGAGIGVFSGSISITDSIIAGNAASNGGSVGGGLYISNGGYLLLNNVVVENNRAGQGGGIYMYLDAGVSADIMNSLVAGNTAFAQYGAGGGIDYRSAGGTVLTLHSATLSGNRADWGGGLSVSSTGDYALLVNTTISGNTASIDGGGLLNSVSVVQLSNVTITENSSVGSAVEGNGDFVAENSVIAANTTTAPAGGPDCSATITSAGYNLIGDDTGCTVITSSGDQVGNGSVPLDPLLGPLAWHGGKTPTHLPLKNGSELSTLIEMANPGGCTWDSDRDGGTTSEIPLDNDQRFFTRLYDADGSGGARCDIGAVEWSFCDDGISNNGETGIDCDGGGCGQCACPAADRAQVGGVTYATMLAAYDSAYDGALIEVLSDATPSGSFVADRNIYAHYSMGKGCDFLRNRGETMLTGPVSIEQGTFVLVAGSMSIN